MGKIRLCKSRKAGIRIVKFMIIDIKKAQRDLSFFY
jgi:hypothetical protein